MKRGWLQVPNLDTACGNAGNASSIRVTFQVAPNREATGTIVLNVELGGVLYATLSLTQATTRTAQSITLTASGGAQVAPSVIAGQFFDQTTPVAVYVPVAIDIPCAGLGNYSNTTLTLTHNPCTNIYQLDNFAIAACRLETCGGQNVTCPASLVVKPNQACTPGYDCMCIKSNAGRSKQHFGDADVQSCTV
jgi:hypothetical protein